MSLNTIIMYVYLLTNCLKPKIFNLVVIENQEKQQIFTFDSLDKLNILAFSLGKTWLRQ